MRESASAVLGRLQRLPAWFSFAIIVPVGVVLLGLFRPAYNVADMGLYDWVLGEAARRKPADPKPYVLVEIDDPSVDALGRFPWSRTTFADLFERTTAGGARVVGVDVLFADPSDPAEDRAMADSMRSAGNIVLASAPIFDHRAHATSGLAIGQLETAEEIIDPIPEFRAAAAGIGSISVLEDPDGSLRVYNLVVRYRGQPYGSMAFSMAEVVLADESASAPMRGDGTVLINYGSLSPGAVLRVSFADVLGYSDARAREIFGGRIVMVGKTYLGGVDYGPTPLRVRTPLAYTHIYALHTILSGELIRKAPTWLAFLLAVIMVGFLVVQIPRRNPVQLFGQLGILIAVLTAGAVALLAFAGVFLGPTWPTASAVVFVSAYGLQQWWVSNRNLRIRNLQLAETLENLRQTRTAKERLEAELHIARDIQLSMLPVKFPAFPDRPEFDLFARVVPAREVGGDLYDFFFVDADRLCLMVGDVSGKGVPAALFMALTKTLVKSVGAHQPKPSATVQRVNRDISLDNESSMFVTVFLAMLNVRSGELAYCNAGHNPPHIRRRDGSVERLADRHGPVLGALSDRKYGQSSSRLDEGDVLLLYTDGVTEAMNPEGEFFTEQRLLDLIGTREWKSAEDLVRTVEAEVKEFEAGAAATDDVTLLALKLSAARSVTYARKPGKNADKSIEYRLN